MSTVDRITSLAKQKGITQAFICDQFNLNRNWFATIRKYNIKISDERLNVIAGILGTTVAYLKEETDDPSVPSPQKEKSPSNDGLLADEQAVLSIYRMTPPEKRLDFIRQLIALVPDEDQTELAAFVLEAIKTSK